MARIGAPAAVAAALALAAVAGMARAQDASLATVRIEQVRVQSDGRRAVWVAVLDRAGRPMAADRIVVEEEGREIPDLESEAWRDRHRRHALEVIVDPHFLAGDARATVAAAVRALAGGLGPGWRVRVTAATPRRSFLEAGPGDLVRLVERLERWSPPAGPARPYDALYDAMRRAARRGGEAAAIALISRGADDGSGRTAVDVLAAATAGIELRPVLALIVEDRGAGPDGQRLARLAGRTGGIARHLDGLEDVPRVATDLSPRVGGAVLLRYRAPGRDAGDAGRRLKVTAERGGARRSAEQEFLVADVSLAPWWRRPGPWLWAGALLLIAVAAGWALRRRPMFTLHVERGADEGCRFEVFGTPVSVGAANGNDITVPEPRVSRHHLVLERRGDDVEIVDLNSENGTFVNEQRVSRRRLDDGDRIGLGGAVVLIFQEGR
jgi:hypothetical protein